MLKGRCNLSRPLEDQEAPGGCGLCKRVYIKGCLLPGNGKASLRKEELGVREHVRQNRKRK